MKGRTFFAALFVFLFLSLFVPVSVASADEGCPTDFSGLLGCLADRQGQGPLTITLKAPLEYGGKQPKDAIKRFRDKHRDLSVQVPPGGHTGTGGTVLLMMAAHRRLAPDAEVDLLAPSFVDDLRSLGVCELGPTGKDPCKTLAADPGNPKPQTLPGQKVLDAQLGEPLGLSFTVSPSPTGRRTSSSSTATTKATDDSGQSADGPLWAAVGALTAFVIAGTLYALYRTRGEGPPRHALAAVGPGATPVPAPAPGPAPPARPRPVEPRRVHGRSVGPRRNPSARAVVRTELHPQGYIEIDGVLHRAVWAEPDRPPPAPGAQVDFTRPHEADSDVLYAFSCEGSPHPHH